jgi:hypothetical protein
LHGAAYGTDVVDRRLTLAWPRSHQIGEVKGAPPRYTGAVSMRPSCSAIALAFAVLLGACTPPPRPPAEVGITFNADPGKLPFDPHGARLRAARDKLAQVVGRAVALELDVALIREYRAWFETGLTTAMENAGRDLGELKRTRAELWTAMEPKIAALSLRYDASANKGGVRLEADRETIQITVPPKATSFLPHEAALLALEAQYDAGLPERYADGVPPTVSIAEKRAYFRALTGQKPPPLKPDDPATARGIANDVRPTAIARAVRFYEVTMPQDLKAEIHEWLLSEGNYLRDGYLLYPDVVKAAPPTSAFRRAEAAWVDWTQKNADRFTDLERTALARIVFVKAPPSKERGSGSRYLSFAFPGFDRLTLGLGVLEEWAEAGHRTVVPGRDRLLELFEFIVCPFEQDDRGERVQSAACERDFYRLAAETEANQKRLLDFLLQKKDEVLVETVFGNYMRMVDMRTVLYLWRGLEANEALWKAATRTMAEELNDVDTARLQDEALRLWQAHPARRGSLLYLLSQIDRYGNDKVAWGAWGETGGGRASAADFAGFLAHGRRAVATSWVVWPLLGRGFSRAEALVPGLDRFIGDPKVRFYHPEDPELALQHIVNRMCAEKNFADLAKMHTYLKERIRKVPPDEKAFAQLIEDTSRGRCKPNARPVVRAAPLDVAPRPRAAETVSGTAPSP